MVKIVAALAFRDLCVGFILKQSLHRLKVGDRAYNSKLEGCVSIVLVLQWTSLDGPDVLGLRARHFDVTLLQLGHCKQVPQQLVFAVVGSRADDVAKH